MVFKQTCMHSPQLRSNFYIPTNNFFDRDATNKHAYILYVRYKCIHVTSLLVVELFSMVTMHLKYECEMTEHMCSVQVILCGMLLADGKKMQECSNIYANDIAKQSMEATVLEGLGHFDIVTGE